MNSKKPIYMYEGSIYCSDPGRIIETPAVLIDKTNGTLLAYGNLDDVNQKFDAFARVPAFAKDLVCIDLSSDSTSREEQCYIMRRLIEHTASGFGQILYAHITTDTADEFDKFIRSEMARVPLKLD